ncbi:CLUMA_CG010315, isoform A [Clunio marinus]|uniref:CLUMA_CG010315, isoform A n=1 Tax=Clunio marinus TaxID=568069 RepID=A0A1J1IB21_9DIPT|nr:CLUMA_CG010315, isoform A [Clunio marinus]
MTNQRQVMGWSLFTLIVSHCLLMTFAYPQQHSQPQVGAYQHPQSRFLPRAPPAPENSRKYAEKPNALKKVALDDIDDDIQTNQISDNAFSWSNMLGMVMQMFFNGAQVQNMPSKSDDIDNGLAPSPWANIISVGLKIITALLGGGANNDGIDKVDNGNSPMQGVLAAVFSTMFGTKDPEQVNTMAKQAGEFISIVVNLLDALKTSFSHRSLNARSMGKKDSMSDAAVASISMIKGYVRTYQSRGDKCMQRYLCEANEECSTDVGGQSIFCQLGTYATSFLLERQSGNTFESLYEAGRKGRSGVDCKQIYLECNEV